MREADRVREAGGRRRGERTWLALVAGCGALACALALLALVPYESASHLANSLAHDRTATLFTPALHASVRTWAGVLALAFLAVGAGLYLSRARAIHRIGVLLDAVLDILREDLARIRGPRVRARRAEIAATGGVFLLFLAAYLLAATLLVGTEPDELRAYKAFHGWDLLRVVGDLAVFRADHNKALTHPLFVLLFNPAGTLLARLLGSPVIAAMLLGALMGALAVVLVSLCLRKAGLGLAPALLWGAVVGLSASHLVFSVFPETFVFAAASLILLVLLVLVRPGNLLAFVPAGMLAFGVTITNFAQAALLYAFSLPAAARDWRGRATRFALFVVAVLTLSTALHLASSVVYGHWPYFLRPPTTGQQDYLFSFESSSTTLQRAHALALHIAVYNIVAPRPYVVADGVHFDPAHPPALGDATPGGASRAAFDVSSLGALTWPGTIALALWGILLGLSLARSPRFLRESPLLARGLLGCLLFNFALHMRYGHAYELFLYTPHWTALVVLWVALSLQPLGRHRPFVAAMVLFVASLALNDVLHLRSLQALAAALS